MRSLSKRALLSLAAVSAGLFAVPVVASAASSGATGCAGDARTLTWSPPAVAGNLTGYHINHQLFTPSTPHFDAVDVGPQQTSLPYALEFGLNIFDVYAVDDVNGMAPNPFVNDVVFGNISPQDMVWDPSNTTVGPKKAAVAFRWPGPVTWFTSGGVIDDTVRVTASPGGATVDIPVGSADEVLANFTGLTNGRAYTFRAVTFNNCGASGIEESPPITPGVDPAWTQASPPLTMTRAEYLYRFAATGEPRPTYRLVGAPSWLVISPTEGTVRGRPPAGTTSFSYSVVAGNGVGVAYFTTTDIVAGPFTVSAWSP